MRGEHPKLDIPRASSVYPDDVSPPDSPRTHDGARSSSPNISPITDSGSGFRGQTSHNRTFVSSIPLPAPQNSGGTSAYISSWREKLGVQGQALGRDMKTKWDAYSGEPTASDKGKRGSARPGEVPDQSYGPQTTISSTSSHKPSIFTTTLRKVQKKEPAAPPPPREEWKGASGRAPIVPPVADKPNPGGKSKALPTPSQRRQKQGFRQAAGLKSPEGRNSPAQDSNGRNSPAARFLGRKSPIQSSNDEASAPAPLKVAKLSRPIEPEPTVRAVPPRSSSNSPHIIVTNQGTPLPLSESKSQLPDPPHPQTPVRYDSAYDPPPSNQQRQVADIPPRISSMAISDDFTPGHLASSVQHMNIHNEPASRFSATTYNTTAPDSNPPSRRQSEEIPPPVPAHTSPSILNRKRPVPTSGAVKPPSRKPTPSQINVNTDRDSKSLPSQPAGDEAVDRVTLLEAKLSSLNRRKDSLQTVIHELTHVVQPSSVAYDMASRQEIKKTVEGLQAESAIVAKEIHDTGLKLHRALKKRDENALFEPTGLWVRRVTE